MRPVIQVQTGFNEQGRVFLYGRSLSSVPIRLNMTTIAHSLSGFKIDRVKEVTQRLIEAGVTFSFRHYRKDGKLITEFYSHNVDSKRLVPEFEVRLDDRQQAYMWLVIKHDR